MVIREKDKLEGREIFMHVTILTHIHKDYKNLITKLLGNGFKVVTLDSLIFFLFFILTVCGGILKTRGRLK